MRRLEFFPAARDDLADIGNWIAKRSGNRKAGRAFVERIRAHCRRMAQLRVQCGRPRDDLAEGLRSIPFGSYIIFIRYTGDALQIVAVLHAARNLPDVLEERDLGN